MAKIKIWFGVTKGNWGGAQKYVYDLATHLPAERFEVAVIAGRSGALVEKLKARKIPVFNLETLGRDINPLHDFVSFWRLLRVLRKNQPDILHLNSPKMGLLGALAGRLVGVKKIIYTSHGWPFLENRPWLVKLFFKILCWKIVWLCHETIVISKSEQRNKKMILIYNGIGPITFLTREAARQQLNLPPDALGVGTIAELHKNKGLNYLVEAATQIKETNPDVFFMVIGEGEERKNLENKNLILTGNIPNAASLLSAFDIFVLPSIKEGLPYVILEAGLAGLPVIATRVGGIPEMIENNTSGLLTEPKNPADLKTKIEFLIAHPEKRKIYGNNLRGTVIQDFSLEKMVSETMKIYDK